MFLTAYLQQPAETGTRLKLGACPDAQAGSFPKQEVEVLLEYVTHK